MKSIYEKTYSCVKLHNNTYTEFFPTVNGCRQGDPVSPTASSIFFNDLLLELDGNVLAYADDIVLFSDSETGLQKLIDKMDRWCKNGS